MSQFHLDIELYFELVENETNIYCNTSPTELCIMKKWIIWTQRRANTYLYTFFFQKFSWMTTFQCMFYYKENIDEKAQKSDGNM